MISPRRLLGSLLPLLLLCPGCQRNVPEQPTLIVFAVVDQLRGDLLERYDTIFTGGFRRLLDEGHRFTNAVHDHGYTATAAGHATLSTGLFPSRNGIVGNEWLQRTDEGWRSLYSVEDTLTHILGLPLMEGRSPRNLLRGGLADWMVGADSATIVVAASKKDRAAIPLSGKTRGHTYWIPDTEARMITSSFYASEYPAWVERFNRERAAVIMGDSVWASELPPGAGSLSRGDTSAYEGDGVHTSFPHRFHEESEETDRRAQSAWVVRTPFPDEVVGAFAQASVQALGLGSDPIPDLLGLSFSQADFVGHDYGPLSREQLDNLVRLDRVLAELMELLDDQVGPGRWVMALSGDHGTLTIPEVLREEGYSAARAERANFSAIRQVFRDLREAEGSPDVLAQQAVVALESLPFVADALTPTEMATGPAADSFAGFLRNSYLPDRWFRGYGSQDLGVMFRFVEGFYPSTDRHGTGHGSPYYYDRHVPLVFLGPGVEPGISTERVRTVDAAPTLAQLAGIPMPSDLDGQPLLR